MFAFGSSKGRSIPKARSRTISRVVANCSLTLCLAVGALWLRSVTAMDQVRSAEPFRQTTFVSANGEFCVQTVTAMIPEFEPGVSIAHAMPSQYRPSLSWEYAGFGAGHDSFPTLDGPIQTDTFMFPLWLLVVVLAIPPVLLWDGRRAVAITQPAPVRSPAAPEPALARTAPVLIR